MTRTRTKNGFTLFETMVALSILALAFVYLLGAFSDGLRAVQTTDDYARALHLAQTLMDERTGSREQLVGDSRGSFGVLSWTVLVDRADAPAVPSSDGAGWEPFHISVKVTWPPNRQILLETLKLGKRDARS